MKGLLMICLIALWAGRDLCDNLVFLFLCKMVEGEMMSFVYMDWLVFGMLS